ncbi:exopolysaccharide biosynthesis polyprenyl glycosylphosphotransferase [Streptomyces sp. NPDC005955]|uniref:sugar transferase n=1 Tax=Streptomyces sp. NPDC005955 TaxID=3364738 RepID=UPI0036897728
MLAPRQPGGGGVSSKTGTGTRRARPRLDVPLLALDAAAGLLASFALTAPQRHPLLVAGLALGIGGWHARTALRRRAVTVPAVLAEAPALAGRTLVGWALLGAFLAALSPGHALTLGALTLGCTGQALVSCAGRAVVYARRRAQLVRQPHAALVIGDGHTVRRVTSALLRQPGCGVRPVGIVAAGPVPASEEPEAEAATGPPVLTTTEEVRRALVQNGVRHVLIAGPEAHRTHAPLLRTLTGLGHRLWCVAPDADAPGRTGPRLAGFVCAPLPPGGARRVPVRKRALDMTVSGALLLAGSPVLAVCAALIRITDGPGVLFRQERIGRGGRPFTLLKFRTLRPADAREAATRWSVADDSRVGALCRFLRRTSLDELPQLWNVFRGDMSLVGPRPERPYFVRQFSRTYEGYAERHRMPSGITGLAQVEGLRGDTSIEDRARFDNAYIDTWSLWQDVCILLRTAAVLVRPTGS